MDLPPVLELMDAVRRKIPNLEDFLLDLIRIPSVYGHEEEAQAFIRERFERMGAEVMEVPIGEALRNDPEYTRSEDSVPYEGRSNLVIEAGNNGDGNSLILNTHSDVVPAGPWEDGFKPTVEEGILIGRGAVDCKGHVGAVLLLHELLEEFDVELSGKLDTQVVIEEEIGGNGSLSLIRQGYKADGVVVLEGSDLTVCPANRGAVWFKATVMGKPVHMAKKYDGVSAIDRSIDLIRLLYDYEDRLTEESSGQPLFSEYDHPVQVNIGRMEAGDWPATVPGMSILEGGVGFLPNRTLASIEADLRDLIEGDDWLSVNGKIEFERLHNDAYQIPADHPLTKQMVRSAKVAGIDARVRGMIASCDARLFNRVGGMPTIVFGAGDIDQAHSSGESVNLEELSIEAVALFHMACAWCGTA